MVADKMEVETTLGFFEVGLVVESVVTGFQMALDSLSSGPRCLAAGYRGQWATTLIVLCQETQPKHTKMSPGGITQARGRVRGGPVRRNTSSKIGGSITICSSRV